MRFLKLYKNNWKKSIPNTRQAMTSNKYIIIFNFHVPYVDDFEPKYIYELQENNILDKRRRTSLRRYAKYICMDHKSMHPSKA